MLVLNTRWNTYHHLPCPQKKKIISNTVPIVHLANANLPAPPRTRHTAPLLLLLVVADRVRDLKNHPFLKSEFIKCWCLSRWPLCPGYVRCYLSLCLKSRSLSRFSSARWTRPFSSYRAGCAMWRKHFNLILSSVSFGHEERNLKWGKMSQDIFLRDSGAFDLTCFESKGWCWTGQESQ